MRNFVKQKKIKSMVKITLQEAFASRPVLATANTYFRELLGRDPDWSDMTDENLTRYKELLDSKGLKCQSQKKQLVALFNMGVADFPSRNYAKILASNDEIKVIQTYLNVEQMDRFAEATFESNNERYVHALFTIMMYTGAQYDYASKFTEENILGQHIFYTLDNGTDISVPAHPRAVEAIRLMNTLTPVNKYITRIVVLKRVARKAGLTDIVTDRKGRQVPLYDSINFQSAIVSFATALHLYGYKPKEIMQLIGRESLHAVRRYVANYIKKTDSRTDFFQVTFVN